MTDSNKTLAYCKKCGKDVKVHMHKWSTVVCDVCNTIISSDISADKVIG